MTAPASFARAVDSLFGRLGMTAMFEPGIGSDLSVTVIPRRPDEIIGLGQSDFAAEVTLFDLRVKEVAEPKSGDVIFYQSIRHRIIGEPRRDIHRLIWTLEAVRL
ncbi:MAG: hypothetical protein ACK52W_07810 [Alphaproteobacteria bacterium]